MDITRPTVTATFSSHEVIKWRQWYRQQRAFSSNSTNFTLENRRWTDTWVSGSCRATQATSSRSSFILVNNSAITDALGNLKKPKLFHIYFFKKSIFRRSTSFSKSQLSVKVSLLALLFSFTYETCLLRFKSGKAHWPAKYRQKYNWSYFDFLTL